MAYVLIVEPNRQLAEQLAELIQELEHKSLKAYSAKEGEELLEQESVALILANFQLPDESGDAFLRRIKYRYPHVRGVLLGTGELGGREVQY